LTDRIETIGGSFFEQLPEITTCIPVDDPARLGRGEEPRPAAPVFEALPSGGAVVISELLVNDEKTGPAPAALMSLNMLIGRKANHTNIGRFGVVRPSVSISMLRLISAAGAGPVFSSLTRSSLMTTAPPLGKASKDRRSRARFFASSQSCRIIDRRMHVVISGKLLEEAAAYGLDAVGSSRPR